MVPVIKKLSPSLTLKTVQTDKFKTERISVTLEDKPDRRRTPVTRFVFSVLKRGCAEYPTKMALNKRLDELYSSSLFPIISRGGDCCKFGFAAEMLGNEYASEDVNIFDGTLDLLFKVFFEPLLDENRRFLEKYVESERQNICDTIKSVINTPRTYATKRLVEIMYEGDDYSISSHGTVELVNSITVEELTETYRDIIENSSYEVFYVGAKSADEVEKVVSAYFNKYCYGKYKEIKKQVDFSVDTKSVKRVDEKMKLLQGILMLGFKTGVNITCDKDFYAMLLANEVFGGSPISKLFMNVRERLGLCYYCGSRYDSHKGLMYVSSGIEKSDRKKAEKEILKQFKNLQNGKITDSEFTAAKKSIINIYSETADSASGIERYYTVRAEYGVADTIEEAKRKIGEVTLEDVVRVARNIRLDTVYFLCGKEENDDKN